MDHPACVSNFIRCIHRCIESGSKTITIYVDTKAVFPNACVPISGIIQYYKINHNVNFIFNIPQYHYLLKCGFTEPYNPSCEEIEKELKPFDKIFMYDETQVAALTQVYINAISRSSECAEGIISSLIWCLNEAMDNVLLHSGCSSGYIMVQFHPSTKHIAICIFDYGVGIFETLKNTKHKPTCTLDSLSLCIQEGVGDGKGQGNGLFGLYQIVKENNGRLTITSKDASIILKNNNPLQKFSNLPILENSNGCTIIDFQLDLGNDIDIKSVFRSIGGFDGFDIRLDNMLDDNNHYIYDVYKNCTGTATREAGKLSYNDVINTARRLKVPIVIDFTNVQNVSSSYIDEFIAKMVINIGFCKFNQLFKLFGMNETVEHLCNRSVFMRISGEWTNESMP